jgi:zinc protease
MVLSMLDQLASSLETRVGFLMACMSLATVAFAFAVDRVTAAPRVSEFKLANGLQVVVIPDQRAPVVTHMVWYKVGAADEPPGTSGIAHFLEHLMFKGTETIPPGQFSKIVARKGGDDNAFTNHDVTAYFQRVAKDRLPMVMEMEADRMANLRLDPKDVDMERMVILEERRSRVDNDPSSILQEQMMAALYQNHPYGIPVIGWEHEMRELSKQDALDFYERFYAPNNAILIVAGDVEPEEVRKLAEETYGKVSMSDSIAQRQRPAEPPHNAAVRVKLEDPRAGRSTVQRHYLGPSYASAEPGEAEALDLLMRIGATGTTSRLYKSLVVDQKKAASAGGWYSDSGLDGGRLGFYAIVGQDSTPEDVEEALDAVIADLRENGVTQEELDRVRNAYIAEFVYTTDNQAQLARHYGWRLAMGLSVDDVAKWPERLQQVTVDDVKNAAQKYLDITQSVTGILVPDPPQTTQTQEPANATQPDRS